MVPDLYLVWKEGMCLHRFLYAYSANVLVRIYLQIFCIGRKIYLI